MDKKLLMYGGLALAAYFVLRKKEEDDTPPTPITPVVPIVPPTPPPAPYVPQIPPWTPPTPPPPTGTPGCMNTSADNYDSAATVDDGSCLVPGCMDNNANNFESGATYDDGSCIKLGCTDPTMFNYDSTATHSDGNCIQVINGCTDQSSPSYNSAANTDDGSCVVMGCTNQAATNYTSIANSDDGSCVYPPMDCWAPCADDGLGVWGSVNTPSTTGSCPSPNTPTAPSCVTPTSGCMDPLGDNFNNLATIDDNSCTYTEFTCYDDAQSCPEVTTQSINEVCPTGYTTMQPTCLGGCQDPLAANHNPSANMGCTII